MKCTEILMYEHQNILNKMIMLEEDLNKPIKDLLSKIENYCEFILEYADEYHHSKEENIYFKWIIEKQPMMINGPVGVMLNEHDHGRNLTKNALDAIADYKKGNLEAESVIKENLLGFIDFIRSHIHKEDEILYKMAESLNDVSQDGDSTMLARFEEINENQKSTVNKFF